MPEEICSQCGKMGYRNVMINVSSFHCDHCGYKTEPVEMFAYSDEDWKADCALLDSIYGSDDDYGDYY